VSAHLPHAISFELRVDPTKLPPGLHYAEVHATLPDQEWRGPLFRVPITVVKPQDLLTSPDIDPTESAAAAGVVVQTPSGFGPQGDSADAIAAGSSAGGYGSSGSSSSGEGAGGALPPHTLRLGPVKLTPGQEVRHFVAVPAGATWAELLVRAGDYDTPKVFLIRCAGCGRDACVGSVQDAALEAYCRQLLWRWL
jgi:tripeptidyl-peptidase-2